MDARLQNDSSIPEKQGFPFSERMSCFAILWLKAIAREGLKQEIVDDLGDHPGVTEARYEDSGPLYLVVQYDGRQTRPSLIQAQVNRPGVRAVIVGC